MSPFADPSRDYSNQAGMPYQPGPPAKTSGMAITSLVLGVLSCGLSLLTGIPAIILGVIALVGISRSAGRMGGTVLAVVGMVLGGFSVISGAILVALLLPAIMAVRHVAEEAQPQTNLRQIGLALLSHESAMQAWPAAGANEQGERPRLSWRVHLLPYLEQQSLYAQFHLDEPWDSEHNKTLIQTMPEVFKSPGFKLEAGKTVYLAVTGPHAAFSGPQPIAGGRIGHTGTDDVLDGLSQTLLVIEASPDQAVTWTQPDDWEFDPDDPRKGLQSVRRGGFLALAADGAVHRIPDTVDDETLRRLFTRDDGQPIDWSW